MIDKKIKTTGQLREYLLKALTEVGSGTLATDKAHSISKLANAINTNIGEELRSMKTALDLGIKVKKINEFGTLELGQKEEGNGEQE